ncbi:hypothetical protein CVT24_003173 [Panaeolus cyanescens]|uniref:Uncharacterized protein n=1 Tax=Panaeolus cyanescens TaxID=181874 RepID=A0A409VNS2_9AGAR|nr:hypothetical protein CVT24_003173 [Panaeolus cyanescens]
MKLQLSLGLLALCALAQAAPAADPAAQMAPTSIMICNGANYISCLSIPYTSPVCVNLTGGLGIFNKEISSVQVPAGFTCTFFSSFSCTTNGLNGDFAILLGGTGYNTLTSVMGLSSTVNFDNKASSYLCSPLF